MEKKIGFGAALSLMALTSAVTFVLTLSVSRTVFNSKVSEIDRLAEKYARLDELDAVVRREFYQEVPEEDVLDGMLMGYVYGLGDRYSTYRSDREYEEYQDNNAGVYVGIGITVQVPESGDAQIVDVSEGGSAEKAGIEAGDWLGGGGIPRQPAEPPGRCQPASTARWGGDWLHVICCCY